jgi:hypothetical protein
MDDEAENIYARESTWSVIVLLEERTHALNCLFASPCPSPSCLFRGCIRNFGWTRPSASPMNPRSQPSSIQNAGAADKLLVTFKLSQRLNPCIFVVVRELVFLVDSHSEAKLGILNTDIKPPEP